MLYCWVLYDYHRVNTVYQTQIVKQCVTWEGGKYLDLQIGQDPAQTLSGVESSMVDFHVFMSWVE